MPPKKPLPKPSLPPKPGAKPPLPPPKGKAPAVSLKDSMARRLAK